MQSIRTYLAELEPGVSPSKKSYLVASVGRPDLHSPSRFDDFGGWTKLLQGSQAGGRSSS